MAEHTTKSFDTDLQELFQKIIQMGQLDARQIADAVDALEKQDMGLARQVVANDSKLDVLQREVEQKAVETIARRQPVAVDLRHIIGAFRISNNLERIGDLAKSIAKRVLLLEDARPPEHVTTQLRRMSELVLVQLNQVRESYERRDVNAALDVWRKDRELDALHNALFGELLTAMMNDRHNIAFCTQALFCSKNIERMGDHTTNIAETIYYMIEGKTLSEERPKADMSSRFAA